MKWALTKTSVKPIHQSTIQMVLTRAARLLGHATGYATGAARLLGQATGYATGDPTMLHTGRNTWHWYLKSLLISRSFLPASNLQSQ